MTVDYSCDLVNLFPFEKFSATSFVLQPAAARRDIRLLPRMFSRLWRVPKPIEQRLSRNLNSVGKDEQRVNFDWLYLIGLIYDRDNSLGVFHLITSRHKHSIFLGLKWVVVQNSSSTKTERYLCRLVSLNGRY